MTPLWIGSLTALLLPVPLSLMVPPAAGVSPDPWRIRRARLAIIGFASLVAVTQTAYYFYARGLSRIDVGPPASSVLLWVPMAWFLLINLVVELRRPAVSPLQGHQQRSASLRPRHRLTSHEYRAWWFVAAIWVPVAGWILLEGPAPAGGSVLLASAGFLLLIGPYLVRRAALMAEEPLPAGENEPLRAVYAMRRRLRSRAIFLVNVAGTTWQTFAAALIAWNHDISVVMRVLQAGVAVMALALVATGALELWLRVRIRQAQTAARQAR